jgi:hypothetical protein
MLHAGLDLSRKKIDICLRSESGEHVDQRGRRAAAEVLDSGQPHPYGGSVWPNQPLWRPSGVSGPSLELSG